MAYVKLSAPPTIGNVARNTGEFSTVGVGAAATTSALYVNAANRIGEWVTGNNVSSGSDADGIFVDCSFNPSANVTNCASIGLYPTFAPPGGVTMTAACGLYVASGTQGGAGTVTTGYGLYVTSPTVGSSNFAANIGGLVVNSGGTGTISTGVWNGTAINVAHGGTGQVTLTNHSVLVGAGTTAITQVGPVASTGCVLMSNGVGGDPGFSTATYPITTTVSQILYSSSANVVTGLATANRAVLTTGTTGIPVLTALATDGQLIIGSTAGAPAAASLTAGSGISITPGSNTISIAA